MLITPSTQRLSNIIFENQVKETLLYLAGLESSKQTFTLAVLLS